MADARAGLVIDAIDNTHRAFLSAKANLSGLEKTVKTFSSVMKSAIGLLGGYGIGRALASFTTESIKAGDALANLSNSASLSAESIQQLRFAFSQLSDATDDQVDSALLRFNQSLGDAINGSGEAVKAFERLGVSIRGSGGHFRGTEIVLNDAMRALAGIQDSATRASLAVDLFGREAGARMAGALSAGIASLEEMRKAAPGVISDANVMLAAELTDEFDRMARTVGGNLKNAFIEATARAGDFFGVVELSPVAEKLLEIRTIEQQIRALQAADQSGFNFNRQPIEQANAALADARRELQVLRAQAAGVGGFATRSFLGTQASPLESFNRDYDQFLVRIKNANFEAAQFAAAAAAADQEWAKTLGNLVAEFEALEAERSAEASAKAATDELNAQLRSQLQTELEEVRVSLLSREQVEIEAIERRQAIVNDAHNQGLIDLQRAQELSAEIARQGQAELTRIARDGAEERTRFLSGAGAQQASSTLSRIAQMTAATAQENKKMFAINKAAAIGSAIINTAQGVTEALKLPFPANLAAAAIIAAAGAVQIASIKATQFGGGTTPSLAGTTGSVGGQPVQTLPTIQQPSERRGEIRVEIHGNAFYGTGGAADFEQMVTDLVSRAANDRDVVFISRDSRQASEIRGD